MNKAKGKQYVSQPKDIATLTIGLDIGYGMIKAVTLDTTLEPFPSVYALAHTIDFQSEEITRKYEGDQIEDEEGEWFVGNLALSQAAYGELIRLRGRTADSEETANSFRVRMARVAIGKLLKGQKNRDVFHIRIATGLPVDHLSDAPSLKAALLGQHIIHTDCADIIANVTEVMVMPQPYGCIYSQSLTPNGEVNATYIAESTGVVDVGTYTIDVAFDRNGEYVKARSGSQEAGVYTAHDRIAEALERDLREQPDLNDIETVLRTGRLKLGREWKIYDSLVEEALEPLRRTTLNLMQTKWRSAKRIEAVYLNGGGAPLVEHQVKAVYPHATMVSEPQLANARGYLSYAILAERNGG